MRIHRLAGSAVLIAAASASAQSAPPSAPPKPAPVTQAPAPAAPKPAAPVLAASVARASTADSWNHALQQWHDGKYVDAIDALANVLRATDGDAYLERVALLTGDMTDRTFPGGRTAIGIIQGDAVPQRFIPRLIDLYRAGKFPFDRLIKFYDFKDINRAIADSRNGDTIKPVLKIG